MQIGVTRISVPRNFENGTYMKIEYIQNVNAVQSLSDLIMELRIACFGKHLKNWIWMLVMPHGFTSPAAATTASTKRIMRFQCKILQNTRKNQMRFGLKELTTC